MNQDQHFTFPLDSTKYKLRKFIGRGSTATVYAAQCITNNQEVAIKLINLEVCPLEIDSLRAEIAFWSSCDHPNVVKYYGSFVEGSILYIIMEYMNLGSISEIMKFGFSNGIPKENVISAILKDILEAINYFHLNNKIHRDIKTGNVLVNQKGEVKIGDFGIAANLVEQGQRVRARFTVIGTPCYMAPEVIVSQNGYSEKADIWSLGITAIELATGSAPYSDLHPLEVIVRISDSPPPSLPEPSINTSNDTLPNGVSSNNSDQKNSSPPVIQEYSQAFRDFVRLALQKQPDKRPSAIELLGSKFIKMSASQTELAELFSLIPSIELQYEITHPPLNLNKKNSSSSISQYQDEDNDKNEKSSKHNEHSVEFGEIEPNNMANDKSDINIQNDQQRKSDGIKTEWDFSSINESSGNSSTEKFEIKSESNNSITLSNNEINIINNFNSTNNVGTPTVVQKGKFTITKHSTSTDSNMQLQKSCSTPSTCSSSFISQGNIKSNEDNDTKIIIEDLRKRISKLKSKICSLKNENNELKGKLDNLTNEVKELGYII
ncbi:hypothetical protein M9Y10_025915 [Tritrichomonas musculus]|uniref:non-specific serine/threonine protein kinase n=1 Tax=Tritrichomonas musculus TaxID=1915356 RepID=A0ABR2H989_9EUKA